MERHPHHPDDNERYSGANSYGTDDPETQAHIENARIDATRERKRDRRTLERLVELGLSPDDAETVIEADHVIEQARQRGEQGEGTSIETTRQDLADLLALKDQPHGAATLADFAADLRRGILGVDAMPAPPEAVTSYQAIGLDRRDALTAAGFEYFLRYRLAIADDPAATLGIETGDQPSQPQPHVQVVASTSDEPETKYYGWIDAAQPAEAIEADVSSLLDRSAAPATIRWSIAATRDFGDLDLVGVTDSQLLATLGQGVAEHGTAFLAWANHHGMEDRELLARFDDFYVASYLNERDWAEAIAVDLDWPGHLDSVVDPTLRPFVNIDYDKIARSARGSWDVITGPDGHVYVFLR